MWYIQSNLSQFVPLQSVFYIENPTTTKKSDLNAEVNSDEPETTPRQSHTDAEFESTFR